MATNKNALIRFKVLDKCFRNPGKKYFIEDLIKECENVLIEIDSDSNGISLRQIRDDISFMRSAEGWSIELGNYKEGKKMYYRYVDTSFSINNMPLNEMETNQLQAAFEILSQFNGMPQFEWMHELLPKLKQGMTLVKEPEVIMDFDNNRYLKGIENLGPLHNAIFYKKVLAISYQPFESESSFDLILHPYYLKQYNNRWFLFGYNPEKEKYDWNLAIDRIVSMKEIRSKFHKNTVIKWQEYFEDIIGVTKPIDAALENLVLHFIGKTGKYIETKPLHGSQKSEWLDEQKLEVKLQIFINYELERLILSYADSVSVIQPLSLAQKIKSRLSDALNQYR
ncbi:MAG: WYL domain-containing protein [Ginsengibacter sp.]